MSFSVTYDFVASTLIESSKVDQNFTDLVNAGNTHEAATTGIHGVGAGTIVGTALTQNLTNKDFGVGSISSSSARMPIWMCNLAIVRATTTNAGDSIKITGWQGTALSASNPGYITLPGTTAGQLTTFTVTADVTILLTGAHWNYGTRGDSGGTYLRVLAVNDNSTLRWGVALQGGRTTIVPGDTSATQTSISTPESVLCNAAVSSATNGCREVGYFLATFDDTGGAAEDLWAVSTAVDGVVTGQIADGLISQWATTPTGWSGTPTITIRQFTMIGNMVKVFIDMTGTSNSTASTLTAPIKFRTSGQFAGVLYITDNGTPSATPGLVTDSGGTSLDLRRDFVSTNFTSSGTKSIASVTWIEYEAQL